jgi:ABC-type bacteriocin/lantibiotic exporter with double-glycine peptidase domain
MQANLTPIQRFWRMLDLDRKDIYNIYVLAFFSGIVSLSLPLGIQAIINLIQGGEVSTAWTVLVSFVIIGIAVTGILQIYQLRIVEDIRQKIFARASFDFAYRIPRIENQELYDYYAPELANRFFDTISIQKGLPKVLVDFSLASLQIFFGLILLSFYHPFFIIFGLILIILLYGIFMITGPRGLSTSLKESKYKYQVAHWLEEIARARGAFQLNGSSDLHLEVTDDLVENYINARESHFRILIRQFQQFIGFKVILAAGLLIIGGVLVFNEQMNIGQFVAAEIIFLLIINSVEKLIFIVETVYDVLTSLEKMGYVTDMKLDNQNGIALDKDGQGLEVRVDEISFTYKDRLDPTIEELSLKIGKNEKICIAGPNGAGKSTLLELIAGIYKVQSGGVVVNNLPLSSLDLTSLRGQIGFSLAQNSLFHGTIYDNIVMGREDIGMEDVRWALDKVGLTEYCSHLPSSYNTLIQPEGKRLPRSISQKLMLARAIVHKPRLLVLEDPLEHVEQETKRRIIDFIMDPKNPWTVIAVGADQYWTERSERIILLNKGRIVDDYTYEDFKQTSYFKELYHHA